MTYVDGFVVPVPEKNIDAYRAMSEKAGKIWIKHGALKYMECSAEDMAGNEHCATFPDRFELKEGEIIVFAFIIYNSREQRDEVNKKVMADPDMQDCGGDTMPFDPKRMAYGGFKAIVDL